MHHKLKELQSCLKLAIAMGDAELIKELRNEIKELKGGK